MENAFAAFSDSLAGAIETASHAIVRIDDGSRLSASGVVWSEDGVVVATSHGVEQDNVELVRADGSRHKAAVIGRDNETDLAVLRIEGASGLPTLAQAPTDSVRVGGLAIALGRPGDGGLTATLGLVSRKFDTQTEGADEYIVNTDAVLYPGVSGGALLDAQGRLIGLLNRAYGRGLGVALGVSLVSRVAARLLANGPVGRGYLGVRTQLVGLPEALRAGLGVAQERGLLVAGVVPDGPADKGGLLLGDTLLKINGQSVEDVSDLKQHLRAGQAVQIDIMRGGTLTQLTATVGTEKA